MFEERKLNRLMKKKNFDDEKIAFLEEHISLLKSQLAIVDNREDNSPCSQKA